MGRHIAAVVTTHVAACGHIRLAEPHATTDVAVRSAWEVTRMHTYSSWRLAENEVWLAYEDCPRNYH